MQEYHCVDDILSDGDHALLTVTPSKAEAGAIAAAALTSWVRSDAGRSARLRGGGDAPHYQRRHSLRRTRRGDDGGEALAHPAAAEVADATAIDAAEAMSLAAAVVEEVHSVPSLLRLRAWPRLRRRCVPQMQSS